MAIPKITFKVAGDGLGRVSQAVQKVPALIITGTPFSKKLVLGKVYQVFSIKNIIELGITEGSLNDFAYKHLKAFYDEAGQGTPLWFMLVSDATTVTELFVNTNPFAKKLIEEAKNIRVLGVCKKSLGTEIIAGGMDTDLLSAVVMAQDLADHFSSKYYPFKIILSGNSFDGNIQSLKNYSQAELKDVNLFIANDDGAPEASIGLCLGRQARIPTQRRQNRIKDGALVPLQAYFTSGEKVESLIDAWDILDDMHYTFLRNFPNRSGYYLSGERTLISNDSDFSTLAPGFVMNEAVLIAHDVLVEELSDEIPFTANGYIHPAVIKSWQGKIETNIKQQMFDVGKISGVKAIISEDQNVAQDDTLVIELKIQPVGYADFIEVNIGFTTNLE